MKYSHELIVIGAGAAGLTAAGGCAMFGLKVALIEAEKMGGECLNDGCVPSKALIAAARRAGEAREPVRHGVRLGPPQVEWAGVREHIQQAIAAIAPHDSQDRFERMGCEVIRAFATVTGRHSVEVAGRTLSAPRIVIATGSEPLVPPIKGLDRVPYLTNETVFDLNELPGHLVIVGGGAVGMEMAQAFRRLGSEVTVIEPGELLKRDDRDSVEVVVASMKAEGVDFRQCQARAVEGEPGALNVICDDDRVVACTHLLIAAGRRARISGYGLEELGVAMGDNGIKVDARRRSSFRNIYAIGDCREGPRLTHVAGQEGSNVMMEIALGIPTKADWRALPWCTFTDPEVAQVGLTESQAREEYGDRLKVVREDFADNDRAVAEGQTSGHLKVMMVGRKVVGASICGSHAGEMLLPFTQAITGKSSSFALGSAIAAYPTRSEIAKAAAFSAWEPTVFGTWPKRWARLVSAVRKVR